MVTLPPNFGKINGVDHPDDIISRASREAERDRCIAICEGWIGTFQDRDIQYTTPREYAVGAIEDIIDLIRDGTDPRAAVATSREPGK